MTAWANDGWTSPEGFWLHRPVLLPGVRSFAEVLEYVGEWIHRPGHEPEPAVAVVYGNEISPYCSVSQAGDRHRGISVKPRDVALDAVRGRIVTDSDRLSWKVIVHEDRGRALVILEHGHIIGSHWLAYVDADTIPARPAGPVAVVVDGVVVAISERKEA